MTNSRVVMVSDPTQGEPFRKNIVGSIAVFDASRSDGASSDDFCAVGEVADSLAGHKFASDTLAADEMLGSKSASLLTRPLRQLGAIDPGRES